MDEEERQAVTTASQSEFEPIKRLTTLSAGSIVLIGTFLSDIFPTDKHVILAVPNGIKFLIAGAFVGFGAALISATLLMFYYSNWIASSGRVGVMAPYLLALVPFVGGVICFGAAVLLNLFFGS